MKRTIANLQNSQNSSYKIQQLVGELEKKHYEMEQTLQKILIETSELIENNQGTAATYITERALRLKDLLLDLQEQRSYKSNYYSPIYRQLDRLSQSDLADYMSSAMNRKLGKSLMSGNFLSDYTGKKRYVTYTLDGVTFQIYCRIIEIINDTTSEISKRLKNNYSSTVDITFFPHSGNHLHETEDGKEPKNLLLAEYPGLNMNLGLWFDTIESIDESVAKNKTIHESSSNNRMIKGKIISRGKSIFIIEPE